MRGRCKKTLTPARALVWTESFVNMMRAGPRDARRNIPSRKLRNRHVHFKVARRRQETS